MKTKSLKPFEMARLTYDSPRHLLIPEEANVLVDGHNRIHRMEIVRGQTDQVIFSDHKITIQLRDSAMDDAATGNFPFKILQPNAGTANFRDIQVNAGNLWAYPSPEDIAAAEFFGSHVSSDVDNFNTTLTLPASAAIYVYIGWTLAGGWAVYATDTDDTTWLNFGATDNKHFVIGFIDALTNAASQQLIVSQYVSSDVTWPVGGLFSNFMYDVPLVYAFNYSGARTYVRYSSVVKGTVGAGFPADGTYLYTGTTTDIGPGSNFIAL